MSQYGVPSYAYNEYQMLEGIRAFREEKKRQIHSVETASVVTVNRKEGCQIHGTADLYLRHRALHGRKPYYTCRICQAAFARRYYLKNREEIIAKKKELRRKLKQAA